MLVNQAGEPVREERLFGWVGETWASISDQERNDAIALLCKHLGVAIVRTNATKHGSTELQLRQETP